MPTINLVKINISTNIEKLEITENENPNIVVSNSVFLRPHVSPIKPQKCDEKRIPICTVDKSKLCVKFVISRSHFADGKIIPIFTISLTKQSNEKNTSAKISQ